MCACSVFYYFHRDVLGQRCYTGLVSSEASLTSWGEGASFALVGHPSCGCVMIKLPYGVDVLPD